MTLLFFFCVFSFLINLNLLNYAENFLLCLFFIIFFILVYFLLNNKFKEFLFFNIFKTFYLIVYLLKFNIYFNKTVICNYFIKKFILKNLMKKINLLKNNIFMNLNIIFEIYITYLFLLLFSFNNKLKLLLNNNFNLFCLCNKLNKYDRILFF